MSTATLKQGTHTLTLIGQQDPTLEHLQTLHDGYLTDLVQAIMNGTVPTREEFRKVLGLVPIDLMIVVDCDLSFAEMIAAGKYDWVMQDITAERFPIKGKGKKKLKAELIHFSRAISSDDAEKELDKRGLRPATIEELLAFGATFPEVQQQFPIIALGSVAEIVGNRIVVCLGRGASVRDLDLYWRGSEWVESCRFLAFAR